MDPARERLTLLEFFCRESAKNMRWAEEEYWDPFLGTLLVLGGPRSLQAQERQRRLRRPQPRCLIVHWHHLFKHCAPAGHILSLALTWKGCVGVLQMFGVLCLLGAGVIIVWSFARLGLDLFIFFFFSLLQLCLLALLSLRAAPAGGAAPLTYESSDPGTGERLLCAGCPPGTFLRAPCTARTPSECAPCPAGSFTELWNYMGRCLRCGVCGHQQVLKKACTADSDCQCECRQGFYYHPQHDMCVTHSECPTGQGVLSKGTAEKDTACHICPAGTYSNISSAQLDCTEHKNCSDAGLQTVLRGSTWHDSVCANSETLKDGALYLKEIVPALFVHHKMNHKRLRRIVHMLLSQNGKKQPGTSQDHFSALYGKINTWLSTATAEEIGQLPDILDKTGAYIASDRLKQKLTSINKDLMEKRGLGRGNVDFNLL
ncbi:tumor necrosis factor receptor superfamily member 6B-like [Cololabis saira]|uniref:tumor necrosis factor receptor superfamily member 6B-like n=1 Tax=Cololabis saira TaxID=129043 RepID=UPI002AD42C72|nr:tumor necrosis factor receptor superfamily member 6B-like [Cololabis saira]